MTAPLRTEAEATGNGTIPALTVWQPCDAVLDDG